MQTVTHFDSVMDDLTDRDFETLFAYLAEKGATYCRRKVPKLRDDHTEALHIVIDELADSWRPELTAREWITAAGQRLGLNLSRCVDARSPRRFR
jgi:hypothetical protein